MSKKLDELRREYAENEAKLQQYQHRVQRLEQRKKYYDTYTGRNWGAPENYDFCINSSVMGIEGTAEQIITWARGTW